MPNDQFLVEASPAWCEQATQVAVKASDGISRFKAMSTQEQLRLQRAVGAYAVARADALKAALPARYAELALRGWVNRSPDLARMLQTLHAALISPADIPAWTGDTRIDAPTTPQPVATAHEPNPNTAAAQADLFA